MAADCSFSGLMGTQQHRCYCHILSRSIRRVRATGGVSVKAPAHKGGGAHITFSITRVWKRDEEVGNV